MGTRVDDLEKNISELMTQAGAEERKWNFNTALFWLFCVCVH